MNFEILGPLRVGDDADGDVAVGAGKERALLGLLLLEHDQVVGVDRIIEELWPGAPPAQPISAVRVLVSRLRRCLGPSGYDERVRTVPPGYRVSLDADDLDAERFVRLSRDGAAALAAGDPERAAALLRGALSLWRGEVLADLALGEESQVAIGRLREERLVTVELAIEADLACERPAVIVEELEDLVRSFPLREGLWYKLVVALSRSGRAAAAAERAAAFREVMADVGLEPSPSFAELEAAIASDEPRAAAARPSLPEALSERRTTLIGRRREVERVLAVYDEIAGGLSATVLLSGEPGVGKTSLVAEVAAILHSRGAAVLYGQCDEDLQIPYQAFREALQAHLRSMPRAGVRDLLATWPRLVPLAGTWGAGSGAPGGGDADSDRDLLFDEVDGWLKDLTTRSPVVVIIDDLHWASSSTVQLLRHLSQQRWWPLLFLVTFRDTEPSEPAGLREMLERVHRQPNTHRVHLRGLDLDGVAALLESEGGARLHRNQAALAARIHEETAGNPFFATELIRHLLETGRPGESAEHLESQLPDGVKDVIRHRVERLSAATGHVLRVASVFGPVIPFALLSAVVTIDEHVELLDALDEATASGLFFETGDADFAFAHALVRTTLYTSMSAARRAQLHRATGEGLLRLPGPLPNQTVAVAHHFCLGAGLGDGARAAGYALAAGRESLSQAAQQSAIDHFHRGLAVLQRHGPPDPALEADLQLGLAEAYARSNDHFGRVEAARKAAEAARTAGLPQRLAQAAYWMCRFGIVGELRPEMAGVCQEALDGLGDDEPDIRARLTAAFAGIRAISGEGLDADPLAVEAVSLARAAEDPEILAEALDARLLTLSGGPDVARRLEVADEMIALARRTNARIALGHGHQYRGVIRLTRGDRCGFEEDFAAVGEIGEQMRDGYLRAVSAQWTAMRALLDGRFDEVQAPADEAVVRSGGPNFANARAAQLFWLQHELGDLEAVLPLLQGLVEGNPGIVGFRAALAAGHAAAGHRDEAANQLTGILAGDPLPVPQDWIRTAALTLCAETAALIDHPEAGRRIEGMLRPFSGQLVVVAVGTHCQGAVDRYLGMLAAVRRDWGRARSLLRDALDLESSVGSPPNVARTQLWCASVLFRDGRENAGRELALECSSTARQLGMAGLVEDAAALLRGERRWAAG